MEDERILFSWLYFLREVLRPKLLRVGVKEIGVCEGGEG